MNTYKTKDFSIFKKHASNRQLDNANVRRIKNSIQARNMLELKPIVVNEKMEIIDGQHRLEAAKQLDVDIWYSICSECQDEDIILLNVNHKNWVLSDYLNYHLSNNKLDYIKFKEFMIKEKQDCKDAMKTLGIVSRPGITSFKSGSFKFPENEQMTHIMHSLHNFKCILEIIALNKIQGSLITARAKFRSALLDLLRNDDLDFEVFKNKILINLDKIRICSGYSSYMQMFKDIYNWKNKNRID